MEPFGERRGGEEDAEEEVEEAMVKRTDIGRGPSGRVRVPVRGQVL